MKNKTICLILVLFLIPLSVLWTQELDLSFDPDAVVNFSHREMKGYALMYNLKYGLVFFCPPENPSMSRAKAIYDCRRQYWTKVTEGFDTGEINLGLFFREVDLSRTTLQRMEPQNTGILDYVHLETKKAEYHNDKDLGDFIRYLERNKVLPEYTSRILIMANNPAKRGKSIPDRGINYTEVETGIQPEILKPVRFKNITVPQQNKNDLFLTGGMQLYFEFNKGEYVRSADYAYNVFRDNNLVPLTIVEISPKRGFVSPMLRGEALVEEVKRVMEEVFHKAFSVNMKQAVLDYSLLKEGVGTPLYRIDKVLKEEVHPQVGNEGLFLYYFLDKKAFLTFDGEGSHPVLKGAYVTDWAKYYRTFTHEFGHTLGLRHHFSQRLSQDKRAYNSFPCVMNYSFRSTDICPLCAYGMGIEPYVSVLGELDNFSDNQKDYTYQKNGNILTSYYSGTEKRKAGEYNFGALKLTDFQPDRDGVYVKYINPKGEEYLGRFDREMKFVGEYNMGILNIREFKADTNKVVVHYTRDKHSYIGAFNRNLKFIGETDFKELRVLDFKTSLLVLVYYLDKEDNKYVGVLSDKLGYLGENNFGKGVVKDFYFNKGKIVVVFLPKGGREKTLKFNTRMQKVD